MFIALGGDNVHSFGHPLPPGLMNTLGLISEAPRG